MSSVLPGFEYDIFISYRQKDNKHDGWVTEFVEQLKGELEATFKEDISVYFDINPHDGLLETHDVEASLKEKLKALIFIPIVSRTYCDPNSYAWEHEFIAFIEQASQDRFGLKVKLPGGNVASRVLPVRIHDLEPEDIKLAERHLGFIRPVDFIYHSQGVNRPLRLRDDDLAKTGQQLVYRDQINKVANAIKEIINGLKMGSAAPEKTKEQPDETVVSERHVKSGEEKRERAEKKTSRTIRRKPLIWGSAIAILLIVAGVLAYPKIFKRSTSDNLLSSDGRISVAVMPFQNRTNDTALKECQFVVQSILINSLSSSKDLIVRQGEYINNLIQNQDHRDNAPVTSAEPGKISRKLKANVFISGRIFQVGNTLSLNAELYDAKTGDAFQPFQKEGFSADMIIKVSESLAGQIQNYLQIDILKKNVIHDFQADAATDSTEAFRYFIAGNNALYKYDFPVARYNYLQALKIDPDFTLASIMLVIADKSQNMLTEAEEVCKKLYERREQMTWLEKNWTNWIYANLFDKPGKEIEYLRNLVEMDDQQPFLYWLLAASYYESTQYTKAISEINKGFKIYKSWDVKPTSQAYYCLLGDIFHGNGQYSKEKKLYVKASKDFPDNSYIIWRQARLLLTDGDTVEGEKYMEEEYFSSLSDSLSESGKFEALAARFAWLGLLDKAEQYYRQALKLKPDNLEILGLLAWYLIETDLNIDEGLQLVERALKLSPDDYNLLDTKGWGLFKQGKLKEASDDYKKCKELMPVNSGAADQINQHILEVEKAIANQKNK